MRRTQLVVWAGLVLAAVPASAEAEQLIDALAGAYANNPELSAGRARVRATDEQVPQALAGWRPTVKLNGDLGQRGFNVNTSVPGLSYNQFGYGPTLRLDQPLYQGGRTAADVERAESAVRAARADLLGTEQSILLGAARAYFSVLRDKGLLRIDNELESLLRQQLRETRIRVAAGQLAQLDVNQVASRLAAASVSRVTSEGELAASVASYVAAIGNGPAEPMSVPPQLDGLAATLAEAVKLAEINSPTVIASFLRARAAESAIAIARADLRPTVGIGLSAGADQGQTYPKLRTEAYSATLNLTVPLYQGGAAGSRVRQAQESASEQRLLTVVSRRDAIENAARAFAQWRASDEAVRLQREQVRLAGAAYEDARRRAALGATSTFELLGQLQELFIARRTEITAKFDAASNSYRLLYATGRLTAADLHLPIPLYDPTQHYRAVRDKGSLLP